MRTGRDCPDSAERGFLGFRTIRNPHRCTGIADAHPSFAAQKPARITGARLVTVKTLAFAYICGFLGCSGLLSWKNRCGTNLRCQQPGRQELRDELSLYI